MNNYFVILAVEKVRDFTKYSQTIYNTKIRRLYIIRKNH